MKKQPIPLLIIKSPKEGSLADLSSQFVIAKAYAETAHLADQHCHRMHFPAMAFPAFICSAFALELFMKLLVMRGRIAAGGPLKRVKDHHVIGLWRDIPDPDKDVVVGFFRNASLAPRPGHDQISFDSFEAALLDLDPQPFVDWRYAHEHKGKGLLRHGQLVEVLDAFGRAAAYLLTQDELAGDSPATDAPVTGG